MRTVRKAVGGIAWAACLCALLTAAPAHAQDGDQLFAQAEKSLEAGSYSEAIDQYSKSIRSGRLAKPTLAEAFLKRGRAYQLSGQHARAVADFTNALWLESLEGSNLASAHGWRGASRQALGQSSLAQEDLAKATSLDPQFSAGPVPAVAADPSAPEAAAQSASASSPAADSGGLIDSIFGGSEPQSRPRIAATAPAAPAAAPAESGQPGLLSRLFGSDESTRASADGDASGITVRRLDDIGSSATPAPEPQAPATTSLASAAATPAPAQASSGRPDVLSQILTASRQETSSDGATGPRAKPRATVGASPTRLASLDAAAPAPAASPSREAGSPSLLDRIFGSGGQAAPAPAGAAAAPAPRPEPITVSQSRVASAPPWQLGADNPTAAEERSALPPRVSGASSGFFSPTGVARESARGRTTAAPTRIASLRSSAALEPAASASPAPAGPAAAQIPEPIAAARTPAPQAREEAEPAQQDVARVAWSEATHVQRIAPPRPPTSPVASEPPAAAQPPVTQAPAVASRPEPTPAPTARPATRPVLAASASSPPSVASRIFEVARQAFGGAPAAPQQRVASVDTRQAPTGWGASARRAPTPSPVAAAPRTTARTPPRAQPQASGSGYVVQVSAERSLDAAKAKAGSLARQYGDLLGGARPYVVKADIPGKGTFFRVRIGPYGGQQQVAALCAQLKGRGQDCFTTRR